MLHTEDDCSHDDGGQGGLGDEGAVRHEEGQADDDQEPCVDSTHGSLDARGAVDCGPRE